LAAAAKESFHKLKDAFTVIWTTTPWTIPGNRAISFSPAIGYGLYQVREAPEGNWAKSGDKFVLADNLAGAVMAAAKVTDFRKLAPVSTAEIASVRAAHPLHASGYAFDVPLLRGEHVTEDAGPGFVHTAPGHATEDFEIGEPPRADLDKR